MQWCVVARDKRRLLDEEPEGLMHNTTLHYTISNA